jgi:hypothetical protein
LANGVDVAAVEILSQDFVKGDLDISDLFIRVALQNSFTLRRSLEVFTQ